MGVWKSPWGLGRRVFGFRGLGIQVLDSLALVGFAGSASRFGVRGLELSGLGFRQCLGLRVTQKTVATRKPQPQTAFDMASKGTVSERACALKTEGTLAVCERID